MTVSRYPLVGGVSSKVKLEWVCRVWLDFPLVKLLGHVMGFVHSGVVDPRGETRELKGSRGG